MVKDLFERIQNNKGPLGKWASQAEGYYVFPKLEGDIGTRMTFRGKAKSSPKIFMKGIRR